MLLSSLTDKKKNHTIHAHTDAKLKIIHLFFLNKSFPLDVKYAKLIPGIIFEQNNGMSFAFSFIRVRKRNEKKHSCCF